MSAKPSGGSPTRCWTANGRASKTNDTWTRAAPREQPCCALLPGDYLPLEDSRL
jgi:hypothetical protein